MGTSGFEHMEQAAKGSGDGKYPAFALKYTESPPLVKPGLKTKILFLYHAQGGSGWKQSG